MLISIAFQLYLNQCIITGTSNQCILRYFDKLLKSGRIGLWSPYCISIDRYTEFTPKRKIKGRFGIFLNHQKSILSAHTHKSHESAYFHINGIFDWYFCVFCWLRFHGILVQNHPLKVLPCGWKTRKYWFDAENILQLINIAFQLHKVINIGRSIHYQEYLQQIHFALFWQTAKIV